MSASAPPLRAAIIGLGNIGNLFDLEEERTEIWTHAGAYQSLPGVELVAGADPDAGRRETFTAMRAVPAYADFAEMLSAERPDLVSVCVPNAMHPDVASAVLASAGLRGMVVEKPLATSPATALAIVEDAAARGVVLQVMHQMRYLPTYGTAREIVESDALGRVNSVVGTYTSKTLTMGSHLIDLMRFLGGDVVSVIGYEALTTDPADPTFGGVLHFASGAVGHLVPNGTRTDMVFEVTVTGTEGRVEVRGHGAELRAWRFGTSARYAGYRELDALEVSLPETRPAVVEALADLVACVRDGGTPLCSGEDSYRDVLVIDALARSAAKCSAVVGLADAAEGTDTISSDPSEGEDA